MIQSLRSIIAFILMVVFYHPIVTGQELREDTINGVKINRIKLNSGYNDYSPIIYKDRLIFISNSRNTLIPYYSNHTGAMLDHLVYSEIKGENSFSNSKILIHGTAAKSVQGPATLSPDGQTMYFTGSCLLEEPECKSGKKPNLKIYKANYNSELEEWDNISNFSYNDKNYSVGHPTFSADGLFMIFASNQPGGFGKTDLYITYLENGKWTKPQNLGPKVNSSQNEVFPYINKENVLFYSSDKKSGLGNLDIYSSQKTEGGWTKAINLGTPFNSEYNDFGYTEDPAGYGGYFSSNRFKGMDDDIFRFEKLKPDCDTVTPFPYCYTFYEEGTFHDETLPLVYEWDFGDGSKKRGLEASHCFDKPGNYLINLNIIDTVTGKVYFNEASYNMEVENLNKAHIEIAGELQENKLLEFKADKSHLDNCIINKYFWDFGNGQNSEGISVLNVYEEKGEYEVELMVKGKTVNNGTDCMACVTRKVKITNTPVLEVYTDETPEPIMDISNTVHTIKGKDSLVFKVQVKTSEKPIPIDSVNFKDLENVTEYKDFNTYGYVVGEEKSLSNAYPLYLDIQEKGYDEATIVAFKGGKIISGRDTSIFKKDSKTQSFAQIQGRIINRYGEPLKAEIILENLSTGKIITKIMSDSIHGRFNIILPNEELYGFYAELNGYYSVSNFIDLRNERRNLEIRKNIEMVAIEEINEINLTVRLNNIFFDLNESKLKKESYSEINRLAALLKEYPELKIEISGHTDNSGSPEFNLFLSEKRAAAVKDYLIYMGIDSDRVITKGYGDSKPLVSNKSERGRYLNRRVEFRFVIE